MRAFLRQLQPLASSVLRRAPALVGGGAVFFVVSNVNAFAFDTSLYSRSLEEVAALKELDALHEYPDQYPGAEQRAYAQASALAATRPEDAAILYRLARAAYNLSQITKDPIKQAALLDEALRFAREAKRLDGRDSNVLRWSGSKYRRSAPQPC